MDLEEGEVICDRCNGNGQIYKLSDNNYLYGCKLNEPIKCDKCLGIGKLDWIENVVGKRPEIEFKISNQFGVTIMDYHFGSCITSNCSS